MCGFLWLDSADKAVCLPALFTGHDNDGKAVFLRDIWPSREEIEVIVLLFTLFYNILLFAKSVFTTQCTVRLEL